MSEGPTFLAIATGNTRVQVATVINGEIANRAALPAAEQSGVLEQCLQWWTPLHEQDDGATVVLASVNEDAAATLQAALTDQISQQIWRIGTDIPVPIGEHLDPETITGIDRLLNAAGAWDMLRQACIVVDAGTAVTVDFVDGEGTFHGGAIAAGARMQLAALSEGTAALPEVEFQPPLREAFGKNTAQAMLQGVFHGIRGMVRQLSEQYAMRYGAYPLIVATGGDAEVLFKDDELVERVLPDLQILGMIAAVRHALMRDAADDDG